MWLGCRGEDLLPFCAIRPNLIVVIMHGWPIVTNALHLAQCVIVTFLASNTPSIKAETDMLRTPRCFQRAVCFAAVLMPLFACGCQTTRPAVPPEATALASSAPRELNKVSLPAYRIEPPDLLSIDALNIVPKMPYSLKTLDVLSIELQRSPMDRLQRGDLLSIRAPGALAEAPIDAIYPVEATGLVSFGGIYGSVAVGGMTVAEAKQAIESHLKKVLADPRVELSLAQSGSPISGTYPIQVGGTVDSACLTDRAGGWFERGAGKTGNLPTPGAIFNQPNVSVSLVSVGAQQQIAGEHLVGPDGTVNLGALRSVSVVGLTLAEAKMAIEYHLAQFLDRPK